MRLREAGVTSIGLVHEMPHSIRILGWTDQTIALSKGADALVFPCQQARTAFASAFPTVSTPGHVFHQGPNIDAVQLTAERRSALGSPLRERLGLAVDDVLVLGSGYARDFRKGIRSFRPCRTRNCLSTSLSQGKPPKIAFAWVGYVGPGLSGNGSRRGRSRIGFVQPVVLSWTATRHGAVLFAAADIFFLSSREDPLPPWHLRPWLAASRLWDQWAARGLEEQAGWRGRCGCSRHDGVSGAAAKILLSRSCAAR